MKVHTVQLTKLPRPHSRGVHRLHGFMATIATTGLSSLSQITTQHGPLADQPQRSLGVSCVFADISQLSAVHYPLTSYRLSKYHTVCRYLLGWPTVDMLRNRFEHIPMLMLTRTHPDNDDVDLNSSEGDDPSSSEGVDPSSPDGVDTSCSKGVDMLLTPTPAKLLSVHVPNMSCRHIVRLP